MSVIIPKLKQYFLSQLNSEYSFQIYPEHVLEHTLRDSKFDNLLVLCKTDTALVFGEPNIGEMITAVAKNKYLLLLGNACFMRLHQWWILPLAF